MSLFGVPPRAKRGQPFCKEESERERMRENERDLGERESARARERERERERERDLVASWRYIVHMLGH